jgi:hypothetical protein
MVSKNRQGRNWLFLFIILMNNAKNAANCLQNFENIAKELFLLSSELCFAVQSDFDYRRTTKVVVSKPDGIEETKTLMFDNNLDLNNPSNLANPNSILSRLHTQYGIDVGSFKRVEQLAIHEEISHKRSDMQADFQRSLDALVVLWICLNLICFAYYSTTCLSFSRGVVKLTLQSDLDSLSAQVCSS